MKKQLLCGAAAGAITLALGGPGLAAPPISAVDWSGYYIGAHVGWGQSRFNGTWFGDSGTTDFSHRLNGILGGLQGGHNWQDNTFVYGWEADVSFLGMKKTLGFSGTPGSGDTLANKLSLLASLRGRLGVTFDRTTLLYLTAGPALAHGTVEMFDGSGPATINAYYNKFGGVVGAGAEVKLQPHYSVRLEGLYYFFGNSSVNLIGPSDTATSSIKDVFVARIALNYFFNGP